MRARIAIQRINEGRIIESREGYSRSFVKGFMQLLYLAHAQILVTSPYLATDILGATRSLDSDGYFEHKGTLRISAPSGNGGLFIPSGSYGFETPDYFPTHYPLHYLPGHAIGIVVGIDATAPTPTDSAMLQAIFHGKGGSIAAGTVMDAYNAGDDGNVSIYGATYYGGAVFVPTRGFRLSSVRLKMYRAGNPGTVTVSIRGLRVFNPSSWEVLSSEQNAITSGTIDGNGFTNVSPG